MNDQQLHELLQAVRDEKLSVDDAAGQLQRDGFDDLGFARIDTNREERCGFPEVILAEGKTPEQVVAIAGRLEQRSGRCLITRLDDEQRSLVRRTFPSAEVDPLAGTAYLGLVPEMTTGHVLVVTAGTSDLPIAREAETTARVMGAKVDLVADVGVAGIHRLRAIEPYVAEADAVVVVAGMEGALPSVVGGLVPCPVIAVPTSRGYGANLGGVAALLSMINSCVANVAVVNIDAGFCGGYIAALIATRSGQPRT
ncbi:AIR carboxylase [Planctomycetes bacterium Pan216]|uniref:AIR carboxylase n=1 Tax=Kolteria novifilia TaxID=2527975 RepID=A0A518B8Z3_9BACT|nr:AIR carboxylase [Planctomycetes bacterium Pan216]